MQHVKTDTFLEKKYCQKIVKTCHTVEPDIETKRNILKDINNAKFVDNGNTINIGVVYHVCYNDYNKESVDLDIAHVNNILNKDFNKNADNFNNGANIYNYTIPKIKLYSMYKLKPYKRKRRLVRYTRAIRRNRRRFARYRRINRRRTRYNRRIIRINRRIRRINRRRSRSNRIRARYNRRRLAKYRAIDNRVSAYNNLYNNYVARADSTNIQFNVIQTIYKPLNNITSNNISTINQLVKVDGSPAVNAGTNLNVWIVNLDNSLLGYAQFPWDNNVATDGIVISRYAFGKNPSYVDYNLNKTIIHEIGHWLGLYHTFQYTFAGQEGIQDNNDDGVISIGEKTGDLIEDTPIQNAPTYGDPYKNQTTWANTKYRGRTYYHMYMNYMDYTNDKNMFMLTKEQCNKIRLMMNVYRPLYML